MSFTPAQRDEGLQPDETTAGLLYVIPATLGLPVSPSGGLGCCFVAAPCGWHLLFLQCCSMALL